MHLKKCLRLKVFALNVFALETSLIIAYGVVNVFMMNTDGTNQMNISNNSTKDGKPDW